MNKDDCLKLFSFCFFVIILTGIILFSCSFSIINLNEVGIFKNKVQVQIDWNKIYRPGRYFSGIAGTFILYSTQWQIIGFGHDQDQGYINGKTLDGANIQIGASIVFRLKPELLHQLYKNYPSGSQKKDMLSQAQDSIQKVIPTYNYLDFFTKRKEIEYVMSSNITNSFKTRFFAEVTMMYLREITLDTKFDQTIINQLIKSQETVTQQIKAQIEIVSGQISVIDSNLKVDLNKIYAEANLKAQELVSNATAEGDKLIVDAESAAYKQLQIDVNFTKKELLEFITFDKLMNNPNINMLMNMPTQSLIEV